MAPTQHTEHAISKFNVPWFYLPRLADWELETLLEHAKYCIFLGVQSSRLAAYLSRIVQLESERRSHEDAGSEVLEVAMSPMRCDTWTNAEVVAALNKLSALRRSSEGEVLALIDKLCTIVEVEVSVRLDPQNEAGI